MGCNSRTSYWDFSVTEKLESLVESSNFLENYSLTSLMGSSSSSGSHKRGRAKRDTVEVPTCLVDGCVADLGKCREYHRRHRVCESHSKTSVVTIGCREQRFCQQCSRFHSLSEFDESKRSCRKRLDGHNRRRRKPQPHSLASNPSNCIPFHQDPTIISYGTHIPSSAVATSSWNEAVKAQNNHLYTLNSDCKTNNFPSSFSQGYSRERQFPFLQSESHLPQPHLNYPNTTIGNSGSSRNHTLRLSDGFDRVTTNSDRASSLLSSSQAPTCGFNIPTHFAQHPRQPSIMPSTYNSLPSDSAGYSSSLAADCNSNIKLDCPDEMIPNASNDCHGQTITFPWG